jgi:ABC-type branched-subunit amino acid transport system ATPase component
VALLEMRRLSKDFGALRAVSDFNCQVERGSLHAVVGPNGAGKTTLFNLISGFLDPTEGEIIFNGQDITKLPPHQMAGLGMRRSFQILTLFSELTVLENVRLAIQARSKKNFNLFRRALDMHDMVREAYEVLETLGLADEADRTVSELSHGKQRYLDIGIAMAGGGILLLLDEPTSGLVYNEIPRMGETIKSLTPRITVLMIEHRIEMVLSISDKVTVLDYGRVIAEGTPDEIRGNGEVSKAYLGLG